MANHIPPRSSHVRTNDWYLEDTIRLAELAHSGRFERIPPRDTCTRRTLAIEDIPALREPGLYLAVMREAGQYQDKAVTWCTVTDIGLHARFCDHRFDVHAASLQSGRPIGGVEVRLLDFRGQVTQRARTSPEGVATIANRDPGARVLVVQSEPHFSLIELEHPALNLSEFKPGRRPQLPVAVFIYGSRDLYRPGETVHFVALLRNRDGQSVHNPVLAAKLKQLDGTVKHEFSWRPQEARNLRISG